MAIVEGKGMVPPAPVQVILEWEELALLKAEAEFRQSTRQYSKRADQWGRGLMKGGFLGRLGQIQAAARPAFLGLIGEYSFSLHVNSCFGKTVAQVDLRQLPAGDRGIDFKIFGMKIELKTRTRDNSDNMVRAVSEGGRRLMLAADAFVFAKCVSLPRCDLLGWIGKSGLSRWDLKKSPTASNHFNLAGEDFELLPMSRLVTLLKTLQREGK